MSNRNSSPRRHEQHAMHILNKLQTFNESEELFDTWLIAGMDNVRVPAHRLMLTGTSDFFFGMFHSSLKESRAEEIILNGIDGNTLKMIIGFMYTASIDLNYDIIEAVMAAADYLQMDLLLEYCCDYMEQHLDASNCLSFLILTENRKRSLLYENGIELVCKWFDKLYKEPEFLRLSETQLSKIISNDNIYAHFENSVFLSLVLWFEHDPQNREKYIFNLLSHVRYQAVNPSIIIEHSHLLCKTLACDNLISNWLQWHLNPETRSELQAVKPRKSYQLLVAISNTLNDEFKVEAYNREQNRWSFLYWPKPPSGRMDYAHIVANNKYIIIGGRINGHETNTVECLDLNTLIWRDLPPMKHVRMYTSVRELDGCLYVVGGHRNGNWLTSVERYNLAKGEWESVSPLPDQRSCLVIGVLKGRLYAACANDHTFECYNPQTDEWTQKSYRKQKSDYFNLVPFNGYFYSLGGFYKKISLESIERYDPETDTWSVVFFMAKPSSRTKCLVVNDKFIMCKDYDSSTRAEKFDEYVPETNDWIHLAPPTGDHGHPFKLIVI